jgi:hypothetical protein
MELFKPKLRRIGRVKAGTIWRMLPALAVFAWAMLASKAQAGRIHQVTVTNTTHIAHGLKWNPKFWLGNQDDPVPPNDYRPGDRHRVKKWYFRNPTHNLTFYVVGLADKTFRRAGKYPDQVFNPHGGWNWAVCKYKWVRLPFISFQRKSFQFYLGWRERGDFGGKLTFR